MNKMKDVKIMNIEGKVSNHYETKELIKDLNLGELLLLKKKLDDIKVRK